MHRALSLVVLGTLLVLALSAGPARAGYYMEHEAILPNPADMTKSLKQTLRSWQEGQRYKRESPLQNETVVIDLIQGEVYGINSAKKTYWKMPADKYRQLALLSLVVMGVKLGADGEPVVPDVMFAETNKTSVIEGRKAFEVAVTAALPPGVTTNLWLSKDVPVPLSHLVNQMRVSLGDPQGPAYEKLFRQWGKLGGYPVQNVTTVQTPNGTITTSETLLTFREQKIPASEFAVPKGYALVTDPITALERAAAPPPAGIGAPLKSASPKKPLPNAAGSVPGKG